jgi:hypothetical protein
MKTTTTSIRWNHVLGARAGVVGIAISPLGNTEENSTWPAIERLESLAHCLYFLSQVMFWQLKQIDMIRWFEGRTRLAVLYDGTPSLSLPRSRRFREPP